MSKRGLRGASLDQLEKNLAEAFAILETMGVSTDVRNVTFSYTCFVWFDTFCLPQMKPGMAKRGLKGASLDQLEKNLEEAFAILDSMGVSNVSAKQTWHGGVLLTTNYFQIKRSQSSRMNSLEQAINSLSLSKRSINNEKLASLEAK